MTATQLPLRDYQRDALDAVRSAWDRGVQRPAVVAPTGAGKTVMFAHLVHEHLQHHARATTDPVARFASRALVLVHRDELADQAIDKINQVMQDPEIRVGKVKAEENDVTADVVVASVQTLSRPLRLAQLLGSDETCGCGGSDAGGHDDGCPNDMGWLGDFGLVVVDECHHAVAPSWRSLLEALGCFTGLDAERAGEFGQVQPEVVGFSATLARSDEVGLGSVWQEVAYAISLTRLIRRGYLTDVRGVQVVAERLDLSDVRRSGGDYQAGALGAAMLTSDVDEVVAAAYAEHASDRQGVVFAPTVDVAYQIAGTMSGAGITADVVTGETTRDDRRDIYRQFRDGETQVLVNCMVLTEGWDAPWASCAVIARPTQSAPLYTQMVGRVLRPWAGKTDALVLDVVGVSGRLKLATLIDLEPGRVHTVRPDQSLAEAVEEAEIAAAEDQAAATRLVEQSRMSHKVVELFAQSASVWLRTHAGVWFIPTRAGEFFLWPADEPGTWNVCLAGWEVLSSGKRKRLPWERRHLGLSLELAMAWAQTEAEEADHTVASRDASWRRKGGKASDAQLDMIRNRFGMRGDDIDKLSKVAASDMISVEMASALFDRHYRKLT
jgi:ATP-dependent helicase IRC3